MSVVNHTELDIAVLTVEHLRTCRELQAFADDDTRDPDARALSRLILRGIRESAERHATYFRCVLPCRVIAPTTRP